MNEVTPIEKQENTLPADPMVTMIERVALDPNADIEKLERMLAMKESIDAKAAETEFNNALAAAQAEMPIIQNKRKNDQTRSLYSEIADIYKEAKPIADKHGFSFTAIPTTGGKDGFQAMQWTLRRGAHVEKGITEVPLDDVGMKGTKNKTGVHAFGSTIAYARRYIFCAVFDIATSDHDGVAEPQGSPSVSPEQFIQLRDKIEEAAIDETVFLTAYKAVSLQEFPSKYFDTAMKKIQTTINSKAAS